MNLQLALLDCHHLCVPCERGFRRDLARVPMAVFSNNDGCRVLSAQKAKALGIADFV